MKTNVLQAKRALVALFAMLMPLLASAQTKVEIDGIWYNLISKTKMAEVTYKGSNYNEYTNKYSGSLTIPTIVTYEDEDYSVSSIGEYAFFECLNLTTITIPEGVTSLGRYAFYNCRSLTDITIPESVVSIGGWAFNSCIILTDINIPKGVTCIEPNVFSNCRSLTDITIPENATSIEYCAFYGCNSLTDVTIPEGVTSIGYGAFYNCNRLTNISIPENVTYIGGEAFYGCSSLTSIVLSKNVKYIESKAFANCLELTDVHCYAEKLPSTNVNAFEGSHPEYATLHVQASALNAYKTTAPWNNFGTIKTIENVSLEKCTTPTIGYKNDKVIFACDTEGATIKSNTTVNGAGDRTVLEFDLIPTYIITAYATKEKYEDSDVATLTICWIPCDEEHESEETGILTIPSKPVLISTRDGVLTLSGLAEGTVVTIYTTDGTLVAQQQSSAGEAKFTVATNQVYLVHIGDKVVKIGM